MLNIADLRTFQLSLLNRLSVSQRLQVETKGTIAIVFSDRMRTTAGKANYTTNTIYLNQRLLEKNPHHVSQTFAHELAHLVAAHLYGREAWGHGSQWQSIMQVFNFPATRCHKLDVTGLKRVQTRHPIKCQCRTHMVTKRRLNKILSGLYNVTCKLCGHKFNQGDTQ